MTKEDKDYLFGFVTGIVGAVFFCYMLFFHGILPDQSCGIYEDGYRQGQVDALQGKYKYRLELKQDTVIQKIIERE